MTTTQKNSTHFEKARKDLAADMNARGIGAILWDLATAGFHYLPVVTPENAIPGKDNIAVGGMYLYGGKVYLINEALSPVSIDNLYNRDTEVKPNVVTMGADEAVRLFGNPKGQKAFTTAGDLEEWLTVADCYYEALNLAREE